MENQNKNQGGRGISNRGFASMDGNKQREIASKGGQAAHIKGTAHEWTSEEARAAGRKGGLASHGGGRKGASAAGRNSDSVNQRIEEDKKGFTSMDESEQSGNRSGLPDMDIRGTL